MQNSKLQGYYKLIAMLGKFSLALFTFSILIFIQAPCWAEFADIPKSHWAEASVKKATQDYQIMNGYPGNKFAGTANLSRYEAASIIDKLFIIYNYSSYIKDVGYNLYKMNTSVQFHVF